MRVGIDGNILTLRKTGIVEYAARIINGILASAPDVSFSVHLPTPLRRLHRKEDTVLRARQYIVDPAGKVAMYPQIFPPQKIQRKLWDFIGYPAVESIIGEIDVFHGMSYVLPPRRRAKGILTICDLTFLLFPEYHAQGMQSLARTIRRQAHSADAVIAISEHTRKDIVESLGVPDERVVVTLLAADEKYRVLPRSEVLPVTFRYGIDGDYILYTGTLEPRKNVTAIIEAFNILKREMALPHRLVIAGRKGWLYDGLFKQIEELKLGRDVIFTDFVPDEDLVALYNGASLFVYPSLYEGFGLPPLEAMACGCPVVTSNTSSLPEVVGDAGLMVDPRRPEELAEAMARIIEDSALRAELREKGLKRAAEFSWRRCAEETLAVYRELTGK